MLEKILLVKELNAQYFNDALEEKLLLAALSPPTAELEYDYDRLELLGTSAGLKASLLHILIGLRRYLLEVRHVDLPILNSTWKT